MSSSSNTAILLFGYNRPSHLKRVLISLEDYRVRNIYFFLDGPKSKKDKIIQKEIIFMVQGNKKLKVNIFHSKKNLGIAGSVINGINKLSKKFENLIILEDDCIPRKEFFSFVLKNLNKKKLEKNIAAVCGYQLPQLHKKDSIIRPYILDYFIPWGWGLKSSYWINYRKKFNTLKKKKIKTINDKLINKLNKLVANKKQIWSLDFIIYCYLNEKKFIFPSKSLIKNIGFDGSGVNSKLTNKFNTVYSHTKKMVLDNLIENKNLKEKQKNILLKAVRYFY